jgi:DNA-binding MarR family transcriptional regulator
MVRPVDRAGPSDAPGADARVAGTADLASCGPPAPSLGQLVSQIGRSVGRSLHDALAPVALEPRQFQLLASVAAHEGCTQQAVGASLQIPPSRMVVLVDGLEARSLIERVANPSDRRAYALRPTEAGLALLSQAEPIVAAHEADLCHELSEQERAQLMVLLGRLAVRRRPRGDGSSGHASPGHGDHRGRGHHGG